MPSSLSSTQAAHSAGATHEPIAIVGIGCRFPGGIHDARTFWSALLDGVDAIDEIPSSRFDLGRFYDARPATPGKVMTRWGGFLDEIDRFDAYFFGISPREADRLDPQQRLLLEVAWEALEDAGQVPQAAHLRETGVFAGVWLSDYEARLFRNPDDTDFYMTTGSGRYSASGRLSYMFGFQGPSLTVDTACSSSLVAVHLACQSLRNGECAMALAGGANVILQPQITIAYSQSKMMAPDGRCKFGDARGDGYVRSEGAGLVVLKRLADALADGDSIYAVIRGSAVNNDGRSSGFLATPGTAGQEDLLRKAYTDAGVNPGHVQYIEAHGTGTRAGDPVEIEALGNVLAQGRAADDFCRVGSVKTNLGHTEGAAGIAGLIKVALALKHQVLPASLHFETPNPAVPWERIPMRVQAQQTPWPAHTGAAIAGVSAFGIAGTNAHVVLAEPPAAAQMDADRDSSPNTARPHLLPLSAHTSEALSSLVNAYHALVTAEGAPALADLCANAALHRTHHAERAAFLAASLPDLAAQLEAHAVGASQSSAFEPRKIAFVFSGQGSQWLGMGRSLLAVSPVFRAALQACDEALAAHVDWSLLDQLAATPEQSRLEEISVIQPALFAIQVALAALWRSWGVEPEAVIGHSMGEVAAAHVAGALSLQDAARVICVRSRLMQEISGQGAMLVVDLPLAEAQAAIAGHPDVSVAVSNSLRSTVLSGSPASLQALEAAWQAQEVFCRFVKVDVAAHSPQMDPLRPRLEAALAGLQPVNSTVPLISTVTTVQQAGASLDAGYWGQNLRQPVLFAAAVQTAQAAGCNTLIEISPHPVLTTAIEQGLDGQGVALASCRRNEDELAALLRSLGDLYSLGYAVDWAQVVPAGSRRVPLPAYPWQREHFWYDNIAGFGEDGVQSVPGLTGAARPAAQPEAPWSEEWLWKLDWEARPRATNGVTPAATGLWIILADAGGVGAALAAEVRGAGGSAALVYPGAGFAVTGPQTFSINPAHSTDLDDLFAHLLAESETACRAVIHLWGLSAADAGADAGAAHASLVAAQQGTIGSALHLVQAAARRTWAQAPKLWIVTRATQAPFAGSDAAALPVSALWGLGRVLGAEYPDLWGGLIDLDPGLAPAAAAAALWPDLRAPVGEDELVLRPNQRLASRLVRIVAPAPAGWNWRIDATYLITGGLGGLGLLLADWMAEQGARRLILMGRTPLPPRSQWLETDPESKAGQQIAAVRRLEAKGVAVHLAAVDVGDAAQLAAFLAEYASEGYPPIRGVMHAAAAVHFGLLANLTWQDMSEVLHAKVDGAWHLHRLLPDLDFFVLFSSVAALLGQTGQGNYAAGNAFLDALARHRRVLGLPGLSINWPVWEQTGIAAWESSDQVTQRLAQQGVGVIEPPAGFAVLRRLLDLATSAEVAVLPAVTPVAAVLPRLLRERQSAADAAAPAKTVGRGAEEAPASLRTTLLELEPEQRRPRLIAYLQGAVAQVLRMQPARVGVSVALGSLGLDSLMALELRNRLEAGLQITLPATFAWNYPTINDLLPYLAGRMDLSLVKAAAQATNMEPPPAAQDAAPDSAAAGVNDLDKLLAGIQDLSDEGVLELLKTQQG